MESTELTRFYERDYIDVFLRAGEEWASQMDFFFAYLKMNELAHAKNLEAVFRVMQLL